MLDGVSEHVMSHNYRRADARAWFRPSQEPTSSCWNFGASLPLGRLQVAFKCILPASASLILPHDKLPAVQYIHLAISLNTLCSVLYDDM